MNYGLWLSPSTNNPELDQEGQGFREYDLSCSSVHAPNENEHYIRSRTTNAFLFTAYLIEQFAWCLDAALGSYMVA